MSTVWIIGFLFTIGFGGLFSDKARQLLQWYELFMLFILCILVWPLFLGVEVGERFLGGCGDKKKVDSKEAK